MCILGVELKITVCISVHSFSELAVFRISLLMNQTKFSCDVLAAFSDISSHLTVSMMSLNTCHTNRRFPHSLTDLVDVCKEACANITQAICALLLLKKTTTKYKLHIATDYFSTLFVILPDQDYILFSFSSTGYRSHIKVVKNLWKTCWLVGNCIWRFAFFISYLLGLLLL